MKDFSSNFPQSEDVVEKGPFVKVTMGAKSTVIKKSSLCWLLEESKTKVSTDRLRRFITASKSSDSKKRKSTPKTTCDKEILRQGRITAKSGQTINRNIKRKKCSDGNASETSSDEQTSIRYDYHYYFEDKFYKFVFYFSGMMIVQIQNRSPTL